MKNKITLALIFFLSVTLSYANDFDLDFPDLLLDPVMPVNPVEPIVPGDSSNMNVPRMPLAPPLPTNFTEFPQVPVFPVLPGSASPSQGSEPVRELERTLLNVTGAFPNGDLRTNTANTITEALYILYSNSDITLEFSFTESPRYIYYLSNPRARTEIGPGVFRMNYDTSIQIGNQFIMGQFLSELYSNAEGITSVNIIGNNAVIVILNFSRN